MKQLFLLALASFFVLVELDYEPGQNLLVGAEKATCQVLDATKSKTRCRDRKLEHRGHMTGTLIDPLRTKGGTNFHFYDSEHGSDMHISVGSHEVSKRMFQPLDTVSQVKDFKQTDYLVVPESVYLQMRRKKIEAKTSSQDISGSEQVGSLEQAGARTLAQAEKERRQLSELSEDPADVDYKPPVFDEKMIMKRRPRDLKSGPRKTTPKGVDVGGFSL